MSGNPTDASWAKKFVAGSGSETAPSYSFNADPDTGFYLRTVGIMSVSNAGTRYWDFDAGVLASPTTGGAQLRSSASSSVTPGLTFAGDNDTGVGRAAADVLSLIAGGVEAMRFTEATGVFQSLGSSFNNAVTASVGSSQGDAPLLYSYNNISTCANAGDAVTLPATFVLGTIVYIKNNGAASCDVFPASGDDAGAGANTAVAVANGDFAVFIATAANATWTKLMGGTA